MFCAPHLHTFFYPMTNPLPSQCTVQRVIDLSDSLYSIMIVHRDKSAARKFTRRYSKWKSRTFTAPHAESGESLSLPDLCSEIIRLVSNEREGNWQYLPSEQGLP